MGVKEEGLRLREEEEGLRGVGGEAEGEGEGEGEEGDWSGLGLTWLN